MAKITLNARILELLERMEPHQKSEAGEWCQLCFQTWPCIGIEATGLLREQQAKADTLYEDGYNTGVNLQYIASYDDLANLRRRCSQVDPRSVPCGHCEAAVNEPCLDQLHSSTSETSHRLRYVAAIMTVDLQEEKDE